jgi:hypothetical protein
MLLRCRTSGYSPLRGFLQLIFAKQLRAMIAKFRFTTMCCPAGHLSKLRVINPSNVIGRPSSQQHQVAESKRRFQKRGELPQVIKFAQVSDFANFSYNHARMPRNKCGNPDQDNTLDEVVPEYISAVNTCQRGPQAKEQKFTVSKLSQRE